MFRAKILSDSSVFLTLIVKLLFIISESRKDFGEVKGQGTRTGETNKRKSLRPTKDFS